MSRSASSRPSIETACARTPMLAFNPKVIAWTPVALLAVSAGLAVVAGSAVTPRANWPWIGVGVVAALIFRAIVARFREDWSPKARIAAFVLNVCLAVALVCLSPLFGFYAFVAYLDALWAFGVRGQYVAVMLAAIAPAISQSGGIPGVRDSPWIVIVLWLANLAIAMTMVRMAKAREAEFQERLRTVDELARATQENAALHEQLMIQAKQAGVAEERSRLSREIHDTVAQGLMGVITQLEAIGAVTDAGQQTRLLRAEESARECLDEARRAVRALATPRLDEDELPTALRRLVTGWSETSGIEASMKVDGTPRPSRHDPELFRIAQESLSNVARHAAAGRVVVTLTYYAAEIRLDVHDDGIGFDLPTVTRGRGLDSIQQRVDGAEGEVEWESAPGRGCTMSAGVPA